MESGRPRQHRQGVFFTLLALLVSCVPGASAWADAPRSNFNIPAGNARYTLQTFYDQSGLLGLFDADKVDGISTNAVDGSLEAEDALRIMLKGTPLQFSIEGNSINFRFIEAQTTGTSERVRLAKAATQAMTLDPAEAEHIRYRFGGDPDLEQVVVTGTFIRGVLDIMSPLEIVAKRDMNKTPYATVQDAIQALSSNAGGMMGEDTMTSGNFLRGTAANLRGLGQGATLVLVSGRRQPFSGVQGDYVDLSNIPWAAVERIEVLPDGSSALYGSDAIAGVVNVIMKSRFQGNETQLRAGSASGGASEKLFSHTFGTAWESGDFLASYQYSTRSALAAVDRVYSANSDKREFGGDDFRSFLSSPGNVLDPRTGVPTYGITESGQLVAGSINLENRFAQIDLLPDRRMHNLFLTGTQRISGRVELFGEARWGARDVSYRVSPLEQVLQVPRSNPFDINPYAQVPFTLVGYSFARDFGPLEFNANADFYTATTGASVEVGDSWEITASATFGTEKMEYTGDNQVDSAKLAKALADPDPATAFNAFGGGTNPETLAGMRIALTESARSSLTSGNLVADGTLGAWSQGEIRLAVGGEWRKEQLLRGVQGVSRGSFERNIESAFAELSVPLIGDPQQPRETPRLELSLASRYERYSDFGETWNPKVGLRWALSDSVKLRTSWGTSFKAPKLFDLYYLSRNTAVQLPLQDPKSPTGSTLVFGLTGSNPELNEETASTWTAGLDLAPSVLPNLQLSMTYYSINYDDRIVVPGPTNPSRILLQEDVWRDVITRNPSAAQIAAICESDVFTGNVAQCKSAPVAAIVDVRVRNLSSTTVHGVDLRVDHSLRTALGSFQFGLSGNYAFDFQQKVTSHSEAVELLNTVGNPVAFRARATGDWYQRAWDRPGFGVNLTLDHTGGYKDVIDTGSRHVRDFNSVDVRLSYRTFPDGYLGDVEFALSGSNVLNESPPFANREPGYDAINFEPYGRVVSFSLQKTW